MGEGVAWAFSCIERPRAAFYDVLMALEIARLCVGLLIAAFHARIADFVLFQEDLLIAACRRRGFDLRTAMPRKYAQNFFFAVGISVSLIQIVRLHEFIA